MRTVAEVRGSDQFFFGIGRGVVRVGNRVATVLKVRNRAPNTITVEIVFDVRNVDIAEKLVAFKAQKPLDPSLIGGIADRVGGRHGGRDTLLGGETRRIRGIIRRKKCSEAIRDEFDVKLFDVNF